MKEVQGQGQPMDSTDRASYTLIKRHWARFVVPAVLSLVTILSLPKLGQATGTVTKADLSGPWAMTLTGDTGCGITTLYVTFNLSTSGSGPANITSHTSGCGDSTNPNQTFAVFTLNPNGSGTANLSCGPSCGWNFDLQVSSDRSMFSVVDVSPENPGNFLEGVAIHQ